MLQKVLQLLLVVSAATLRGCGVSGGDGPGSRRGGGGKWCFAAWRHVGRAERGAGRPLQDGRATHLFLFLLSGPKKTVQVIQAWDR